MDQKAITKAESRLRIARKAADEFASATEYETFTDGWYAFLVALKNIYTVLEQGAKVSPQSRQWFGAKAAERRQDALLQYLYEARNDDEHGLEPITAIKAGALSVGVAKDGYSRHLSIDGVFNGPDGTIIRTTSHDGLPVLIEHTPNQFVLAPVRARGRPPIAPPTTHLGQPLKDLSPVGVGAVALEYMDQLVRDAKARA